MSARAAATFVFRHQRKLLVCLALSLAAGGAVVAQVPPLWRAEAVVMVEGAHANVGRADGARALAALLDSRDLHAAVLRDWGERLYPALPAEARADAFARDLSVVAADGAGVVRLALQGADGDQTAAALTALLDRLAEKNRTVFATPADPAATTQAASAREALGLLRKRADLDGEAQAAEAEAGVLDSRLAALKERLAAVPATIELSSESERSKVAEDARAKLFELQTREAELLGKYQDGSVFIQNLRAEKRKVEELLGKLDTATPNRVVSGSNPVRQELEKDSVRTETALSTARARAKAARRQLADLDRRLDQLAGPDRDQARLERAAALAPARASGAAIDGIGIVQAASAGRHPVGPTPPQLMALSALAGLALGLLWAALAQAFSSRLSSPADVERRLGLPVLTSIPRES
ncbi:MAG: hypothetical protein ACM3Q1_17960 [Bacteroidales bacterium]